MNNYKVKVLIFDKLDPNSELEPVDIILDTIITADSEETALSILSQIYTIKEVIELVKI